MVYKTTESVLDDVIAEIGNDEYKRLNFDENVGGDIEIVDDDYDGLDGLMNVDDFLSAVGYCPIESDEQPEEDEWERSYWPRSIRGDPDAPRPL